MFVITGHLSLSMLHFFLSCSILFFFLCLVVVVVCSNIGVVPVCYAARRGYDVNWYTSILAPPLRGWALLFGFIFPLLNQRGFAVDPRWSLSLSQCVCALVVLSSPIIIIMTGISCSLAPCVFFIYLSLFFFYFPRMSNIALPLYLCFIQPPPLLFLYICKREKEGGSRPLLLCHPK